MRSRHLNTLQYSEPQRAVAVTLKVTWENSSVVYREREKKKKILSQENIHTNNNVSFPTIPKECLLLPSK